MVDRQVFLSHNGVSLRNFPANDGYKLQSHHLLPSSRLFFSRHLSIADVLHYFSCLESDKLECVLFLFIAIPPLGSIICSATINTTCFHHCMKLIFKFYLHVICILLSIICLSSITFYLLNIIYVFINSNTTLSQDTT